MEDWWRSLVIAIEQLLTRIDGNRIAAIAISNQRETIGFLDEHKAPVRPDMSWLDERGRAYVQKLSDELSGEWLHRTSGKPADLTPALFRLAWFCDNEPGACARTAFFVDVQSYLNYRLTGRLATSWASDTEQAAGQMSGNLYPCELDPRNAEPYQALMQMQKSLYENNAAVFRKLKRFQSA